MNEQTTTEITPAVIKEDDNGHEHALPAAARFRLTPAVSVIEAGEELKQLQTFVKSQMKAKEDYGTVPGIDKPFLFKAGAEKLNNLFGLAPYYDLIDKIEDWNTGFFAYTFKCRLVHVASGLQVAEGVGSCNSNESKYRYIWMKKPKPSDNVIDQMKALGTGRWRKIKGTWQWQERHDNPDRANQANTILKQAKKRAGVDATLSATRASGIFTQDEETIQQFPDAEVEQEDVRVINPGPATAESVPSEPSWSNQPEPPPAQPWSPESEQVTSEPEPAEPKLNGITPRQKRKIETLYEEYVELEQQLGGQTPQALVSLIERYADSAIAHVGELTSSEANLCIQRLEKKNQKLKEMYGFIQDYLGKADDDDDEGYLGLATEAHELGLIPKENPDPLSIIWYLFPDDPKLKACKDLRQVSGPKLVKAREHVAKRRAKVEQLLKEHEMAK